MHRKSRLNRRNRGRMRFLLKEKEFEYSPLLNYIHYNRSNEDFQELLTEDDIDVNCRDSGLHDAALHYAMKVRGVPNPFVVKLLLEQNGIEVDIKTKIGNETPLHLICSRKNLKREERFGYAAIRFEVVKLLIEHGADVNSKNSVGETCLYYAIKNDNFHYVEYLLDNTPIDPKIRNTFGLTALDIMLNDENNCKQYEAVFFKLLDRTIEVDPDIQHYRFEEFFSVVLRACATRFSSEYFINKYYSKNNSKYHLIEKIENTPVFKIHNNEYRFYCYAFAHDQLTKGVFQNSIKNENLRLHESAFFASQYAMILKSLLSNETNLLVLELFDQMNTAGFYNPYNTWKREHIPKLNLYSGRLDLNVFLNQLSVPSSEKRLYNVIKFFSQTDMDINILLETFLDNFRKNPSDFQLFIKMLTILLPFTMSITFYENFIQFVTLSNLMEKPIIKNFFLYYLQNYGDTTDSDRIKEFNLEVFSLKHICRDNIRRSLQRHSNFREFRDKLNKFCDGLPKICTAYLEFDETYGVN